MIGIAETRVLRLMSSVGVKMALFRRDRYNCETELRHSKVTLTSIPNTDTSVKILDYQLGRLTQLPKIGRTTGIVRTAYG